MGEIKYIKINFTYFFLFMQLLEMFKIIYVAHILFLLNSAVLDPPSVQGWRQLFQLEGKWKPHDGNPRKDTQGLSLPVLCSGEIPANWWSGRSWCCQYSLYLSWVSAYPPPQIVSKYIWGEVSSLVLHWKGIVSHNL